MILVHPLYRLHRTVRLSSRSCDRHCRVRLENLVQVDGIDDSFSAARDGFVYDLLDIVYAETVLLCSKTQQKHGIQGHRGDLELPRWCFLARLRQTEAIVDDIKGIELVRRPSFHQCLYKVHDDGVRHKFGVLGCPFRELLPQQFGVGCVPVRHVLLISRSELRSVGDALEYLGVDEFCGRERAFFVEVTQYVEDGIVFFVGGENDDVESGGVWFDLIVFGVDFLEPFDKLKETLP